MSELHERFIDGLFEARWQPGAQSEVHKGENRQSYPAEEQSEADKLKQIKIKLELLNMPMLALVMPVPQRGRDPDPIPDTTISFVNLIKLILKMLVVGATALFPKGKETK